MGVGCVCVCVGGGTHFVEPYTKGLKENVSIFSIKPQYPFNDPNPEVILCQGLNKYMTLKSGKLTIMSKKQL